MKCIQSKMIKRVLSFSILLAASIAFAQPQMATTDTTDTRRTGVQDPGNEAGSEPGSDTRSGIPSENRGGADDGDLSTPDNRTGFLEDADKRMRGIQEEFGRRYNQLHTDYNHLRRYEQRHP